MHIFHWCFFALHLFHHHHATATNKDACLTFAAMAMVIYDRHFDIRFVNSCMIDISNIDCSIGILAFIIILFIGLGFIY